MLSDEEREAIEILKDREYDFDELYCTFRQSFIKPYDKSIGIILELIKKLSKEIEELKNGQIDFCISDKEIEERIKNKFVSKDKIKAKIEEFEKQQKEEPDAYLCIKVLQSLLEKE